MKNNLTGFLSQVMSQHHTAIVRKAGFLGSALQLWW